MSKSYSLWVHWKQGDDFSHFLEKDHGQPVPALRAWADSLAAAAEMVRTIAYDLEASGGEFAMDADTHHIGIHGDEEVLDRLAENGVLCRDEFDDEEEDEEGTAPAGSGD